MINEEEQIERIENYFSGRMAGEEKAAFENELITDTGLNRLMREHRYFLDGVSGIRFDDFVTKLRKDNDSTPVIDITSNQRHLKLIAVAASVLVLAGMAFMLLKPPGLRQLARKDYDAPFAQIQRSNPPPEDSVYHQAMAAYGKKDWGTAIHILEMVSDTHRFYKRALYYTGHSYAGEKEYESALAIFSNPAFVDGQYVQQAEWNRMLMKMFLKYPREEIIRDLEVIVNNPNHFFNSKAILLMEKLKKK